MKSLIVFAVAVVLLACANQARQPECETEYAYTISHCPQYGQKPSPPPTKEQMRKAGYVEWCDVHGSFRRCVWITEAELRRILRTM